MSNELLTVDESEIPETGSRIVRLRGLEVGIFRVGGKYYAIRNECIHQRGPVCEGRVTGALYARADGHHLKFEWTKEGEILVCPWHGLEFDIRTGASLAMKKGRLRTYPLRVEKGKIILEA